MAGQINWTQYISEEDVDVPLHALRYTCIQRISWYLNQDIQLRPGMRHTPNFGGLGELIGLSGLEIQEMSRRTNPGLDIIELWKERRDLKPTVGNLVKYLSELKRQDILTDTAEWMREEIEAHKNRQQNLKVQCEDVSSAKSTEDIDRILTIDDVVEGTALYDAFVCFDNTDVEFVRAMLAKLEDPREFGFRFFVPGRNNLVGTNSHALTTKIISERCRHMVVILSPSFLRSPACEFQTAYAFSLSPGARDKKIVPIKIEECRTPDILQIMACCDFTNSNLLDWCWKRLAMSIMCPMPNSDFMGTERFVPPQGSALAAWARLGMSDLGGGGRSSPMNSRSLDSGFQSHRGPFTAPVSGRSSHSQPSTSSGSPLVQRHTAPVAASQPSARDKSPNAVSQAFKRITQSLSSSSSSSSKSQNKKCKTVKNNTATNTITITNTNNDTAEEDMQPEPAPM